MATCDPTTVLESIKRQLAGASPCEDALLELIPVYWDLTAIEGCFSTYLHALLTKREAVLALMGCEVNSVDTYDRHRVLDGRTVADTQSTLRAQSQRTGNSVRYAVGHGETRYDEVNTARSVGTMDRHGLQTEVGDGTSTYRDDGRGSGFNNSRSVNSIEAVDTEIEHNESAGGGIEFGYRQDCNYEYSTNRTEGAGFGAAPVAVAGQTGGGSEWRKWTKTRASDSDSSNFIRNWDNSRDVRDVRRSNGTHGWGSFFQADIEWHERDYEVRRGHDRSDTRRHAEAHARGDGDGMHEEKNEGRHAAQSTAKSEFQQTGSRTMNRVDSQTTVQLANSQRFKNLMRIYDQLTEQIEHEKNRFRGRATPSIATLPCRCQTCCVCVGRIAYGYVDAAASGRYSGHGSLRGY